MKLAKETIEFLNKVQREGNNKTRYDKLDFANTWATKHYDDTSSILIYEYEGNKVIIMMERGEYVDYFISTLK